MTGGAEPAARTATSMPYLGSGRAPVRRPNLSGSLAKAFMARCVHVSRLVTAAALLSPIALVGCVIPPPLQTDDPDAAVNHPPVFRSVKDGTGEELVRPGPHEFEVGGGELRITANDTDPGDTLYFRMYVDYGLAGPTQLRADCQVGASPSGDTERTTTCSLIGVCTDDLADGATHVFELDLMDRLPTSTATRLYRDVTPPGEIASYWWNITCVRSSS